MTELGFALFEGEPKPDEAINLHISNAIARVEGLNNEALRRIDRAFELLKLEEAGRLVTLPCKVGDTVYQLRNKNHGKGLGISPRIVSSACVWSDGSYALCHTGMTYCQSKDLGKTWFLTREEAEKALEGMK